VAIRMSRGNRHTTEHRDERKLVKRLKLLASKHYHCKEQGKEQRYEKVNIGVFSFLETAMKKERTEI